MEDPDGRSVYGVGFGFSTAGIVVSSPTEGIDVCLLCLFCVV
jgi:hypothetical protein